MDLVILQESNIANKVVVSIADLKELIELTKYLNAKDMEDKIMECVILQETDVDNKIAGLKDKILKSQENNTELLIENKTVQQKMIEMGRAAKETKDKEEAIIMDGNSYSAVCCKVCVKPVAVKENLALGKIDFIIQITLLN